MRITVKAGSYVKVVGGYVLTAYCPECGAVSSYDYVDEKKACAHFLGFEVRPKLAYFEVSDEVAARHAEQELATARKRGKK